MESFLTWGYVATFMGIVFCTSMLVEFFKEMPYIKKIPTKYFTAMVAFVLIFVSAIFLGEFAFINIPLMILNAILVAFTTTGQYDFHYRKVRLIEDKPEDEQKNELESLNK